MLKRIDWLLRFRTEMNVTLKNRILLEFFLFKMIKYTKLFTSTETLRWKTCAAVQKRQFSLQTAWPNTSQVPHSYNFRQRSEYVRVYRLNRLN